jgi:uncharacterized protein YjbI with pentapeptide repeats
VVFLKFAFYENPHESLEEAQEAAGDPYIEYHRVDGVGYKTVDILQADHTTNLDGTDLIGWLVPQGSSLCFMSARHAYMQEADLTGVILNGAQLCGTDLSYSTLDFSVITGTNFEGAILTEASLQNVEGHLTKNGRVNFRDANMQGACLAGATITGDFSCANLSTSIAGNTTNLVQAYLTLSFFEDTNLFAADLTQANLHGCSFLRAFLPHATLKHVDATECRFDDAILLNADLEMANLATSSFKRAVLRDANLERASLHSACLDNADLARAPLRYTDLSFATFDCADLRGADLTGAKIDHTSLDNVLIDEHTIGPDGRPLVTEPCYANLRRPRKAVLKIGLDKPLSATENMESISDDTIELTITDLHCIISNSLVADIIDPFEPVMDIHEAYGIDLVAADLPEPIAPALFPGS